MTQNARFENIEGVVDTEVIAYETIMHFDPVSNSGTIVNNAARYLRVDGEYHPDIPATPCGSITDHTDDIIATIVGEEGLLDPVSGADLSQVSVAGMMALHKLWFDRRWNAEATALPEEGEPTPPEDEGHPPSE